jgi:hypothetical protein
MEALHRPLPRRNVYLSGPLRSIRTAFSKQEKYSVRLVPSRKTPAQTRNAPRHRIEQPRNNRHFLVVSGIGAACTVAAISVGLATGGGAVNASAPAPTASATASAEVIPARAAQPEPVVRGSIVAADGGSPGTAAGPVTGGTTVTVTGAALGTVASVSFGGNPGTVVAVSDDTVTITTPPAADRAEGTVPVELFDIAGKAVKVTDPLPAEPAAPVEPAPAGVAEADAAPAGTVSGPIGAEPKVKATKVEAKKHETTKASKTPDTASVAPLKQLTFSYLPDPHITAQIDYALAHWSNYNSDVYGVVPGNDCVNFTSQSLVARGWAMDADWWFDTNTGQSSGAWNSSTALAGYLSAHPERATALGDDQRRQVKIGDIVQFDWDSSGDRDHTGIVTRVDKTVDGVKIYYAGHTSDSDYKSVDESLANEGGTVSYWSVV